MKSFPGATIKQLHHYSLPTLQDEKPEVVIIHVGINDLLSNNVNRTPEKQMADEIISIGNTCVNNGVEKVLISSLIFCQRVEWERVERINKLLKEKCEISGFIYIENNEISSRHLWRDGIHTTDGGKTILANNYIDSLNSFTGRQTHFRSETLFRDMT